MLTALLHSIKEETMKRAFILFLSMFLLLTACGRTGALSASDIDRIDREETYADGPFSLAEEFSSIDALYDAADLIVVGTVEASESAPLDGFPQTRSTVSVDRCLKGTSEDSLLIIEEGGLSDDGALVYLGVPPMEQGGTYLLFLVDSGLGAAGESWCIAGAFQGKFVCREGYYFQQATEETKLSRAEYTPVELEDLVPVLQAVSG